jgi:hypothetical protein
VSFAGIRPVDTPGRGRQVGGVKKKTFIAAEAAAHYTAKKAAKGKAAAKATGSGSARDSDAAFQQVVAKIFSERKELLRKLAQ